MTHNYMLKNKSKNKYVKYLVKRYGKKRAEEFLESSEFINN